MTCGWDFDVRPGAGWVGFRGSPGGQGRKGVIDGDEEIRGLGWVGGLRWGCDGFWIWRCERRWVDGSVCVSVS